MYLVNVVVHSSHTGEDVFWSFNSLFQASWWTQTCSPLSLWRLWPSQQASQNSKVPRFILEALQDKIRLKSGQYPSWCLKERMKTSKNSFASACWIKNHIYLIQLLIPSNFKLPLVCCTRKKSWGLQIMLTIFKSHAPPCTRQTLPCFSLNKIHEWKINIYDGSIFMYDNKIMKWTKITWNRYKAMKPYLDVVCG